MRRFFAAIALVMLANLLATSFEPTDAKECQIKQSGRSPVVKCK